MKTGDLSLNTSFSLYKLFARIGCIFLLMAVNVVRWFVAKILRCSNLMSLSFMAASLTIALMTQMKGFLLSTMVLAIITPVYGS